SKDLEWEAVEYDGEKHLSLLRGEIVSQRFSQHRHEFRLLDVFLRRRIDIRDMRPALRLEGNFASLPCAAPDLHCRFEERELVRPRGEASVAAEVVELPEDCHERVVGALVSKIVEIIAAQVGKRATPAV